MAKLSAKGRKQIKRSNFAVPKGVGSNKRKNQYPIHDKSHAKSALSMVGAHGTAAEKRIVRAKVEKKYPSLKKSKSKGKK